MWCQPDGDRLSKLLGDHKTILDQKYAACFSLKWLPERRRDFHSVREWREFAGHGCRKSCRWLPKERHNGKRSRHSRRDLAKYRGRSGSHDGGGPERNSDWLRSTRDNRAKFRNRRYLVAVHQPRSMCVFRHWNIG